MPDFVDIETSLNLEYGTLRKGQTQVIENIVISREPDLKNQPKRIAGFPEIFQKKIENLIKDFDLKDMSKQEIKNRSLENQQKIAETLASFRGEGLSSQKKSALKKLYVEYSKKPIPLIESNLGDLDSNDPSALDKFKNKRKAIIKKLAEYYADFVFQELEIFRDSTLTKTPNRPYSSWIKAYKKNKVQNKANLKKGLEKAYKELLEGNYLGQTLSDDSGIVTRFDPRKTVARRFRDITSLPDSISLGTGVSGIQPNITKEQKEISSTKLWWEVRIYTVEHPISESFDFLEEIFSELTDDYQEILTELGLVHTGVLVGLWEVSHKEMVEITRLQGREISRIAYQVHYFDFNGWVVGNNCGGTFYTEDNLYLKSTSIWPTKEFARRFAKGASSYLGVITPMSACAYSVGNYGINWICHQNSNAFTYRKYGLIVTTYSSSTLFWIFSNHPLLQISTRVDPFNLLAGPKAPGVPGEILYFQVVPPYGWPGPVNLLIIDKMDERGYGLDRYYKQGVGWKSTNALFDAMDYDEIPTFENFPYNFETVL